MVILPLTPLILERRSPVSDLPVIVKLTALKLGQEQTRPHRPKLGGLGVGDEEKRLEGDLALGDEVGLGHGAVLVLGDGFVELVILILLNVIRLPGPDGLGRVAQLPIPGCLLNLLCLGFLFFLIILLNSSFLIILSGDSGIPWVTSLSLAALGLVNKLIFHF